MSREVSFRFWGTVLEPAVVVVTGVETRPWTALNARVTEYSTFRRRILSLALAARAAIAQHPWKYCESCKISIARARARECAWSEYTTKGEHDEHTCLGHPSSTMRRQVCGREESLLQRADTMWAHRAGASHCPLWRLSCLSHNSTR